MDALMESNSDLACITNCELRSRIYQLFAMAVSYPDDEILSCLKQDNLLGILQESVAMYSSELAGILTDSVISLSLEAEDSLEGEYLRLFEIGGSGRQICSLHTGQCGNVDRIKVMEECLRFYNHFGLQLDKKAREMPDFLVTQLEFLHVLASGQADAYRHEKDAASYRLAERDFIERRMLSFIDQLCESLPKADTSATLYYKTLFELLSRFHHCAHSNLGATND